MKKASLLTRLRFSYTYALFESLVARLQQSGHATPKRTPLKVSVAHPVR